MRPLLPSSGGKLSLASALRRKSVLLSLKAAIITFFLVSAYSISLGYSQIESEINSSIASNQKFLVKSLKLGDSYFVQQFINSFVSHKRVKAVGILDTEKDKWIASANSHNGIALGSKGLDFKTDGVLISFSVPLLDRGAPKWTFHYIVQFNYSLIGMPILLALILSLVFYFLFKSQIYRFSVFFTKPVESLSRDLLEYRGPGSTLFVPKHYGESESFLETDSLVDELKSLFSKIDVQNKKLKDVEILKALQVQSRQVAHDIKSPLGALKVSLKAFKSGNMNSGELMGKAIGRIEAIAQDLELQNKKESVNSIVDLTLAIGEIVEEKKLEYSPDILKIEFESGPEAVLVSFDKKELARLLSNIINNGVEASHPKMQSRIQIKLSLGQEQVKVSICDNGIGIAESQISKVTDYGYTKGKVSGSGTGLAHAKEQIELFGGSMFVSSELGKGTVVSIFLNLHKLT